MTDFDPLKLENQLCFPLYAVSRDIVRRYTPLLRKIGLTYTQYIAMMVMWEERKVTFRDLGKRLHLDSGTLTPLVKTLEGKGLVRRTRNPEDGRVVDVTITEQGLALRGKALSVPEAMAACLPIEPSDAVQLKRLLLKLMAGMDEPTGS